MTNIGTPMSAVKIFERIIDGLLSGTRNICCKQRQKTLSIWIQKGVWFPLKSVLIGTFLTVGASRDKYHLILWEGAHSWCRKRIGILFSSFGTYPRITNQHISISFLLYSRNSRHRRLIWDAEWFVKIELKHKQNGWREKHQKCETSNY